MDYQTFTEKLADCVRRRVGRGTVVDLRTVYGNNHCARRGIPIIENENEVVPRIFLEPFYEQYRKGNSLETVADAFLQAHEECSVHTEIFSGDFNELSRVRDTLSLQIVNREMNRAELVAMPHRDFLDLSLICSYSPDLIGLCRGRTLVWNEDVIRWQASPEELFATAAKNLRKYDPPTVRPLKEELLALGGEDLFSEEEGECRDVPLLVLTSRSRLYGAVYMADELLTRRIAECFDSDYFVLPSSVHEVLILPAKRDLDTGGLSDLVEYVNTVAVPDEQILSGNIYYYDRENGGMEVVNS